MKVLSLSRIASKYGNPVAVHTRADNYQGLAALNEAVNITKITGAPVQISYVVYQYGFGIMKPALEIIDDAVRSGYDISCDSCMYTSFAAYIGTDNMMLSLFRQENMPGSIPMLKVMPISAEIIPTKWPLL